MSHTSRLNALLRVRRIQEEIRRGRLAGEVAAERRAQQVLEQTHERYAAPAAEPPVAPTTLRDFMAARGHRVVLAGAICAARTSVEGAAQVTVLARHDWSEAAMRMAALERLEDRAREAASTERQAAEQRTSEESSSAQHHRGLAGNAQGKRP
jgi:flagellar export protein FliJ